MIPEKPNLGEIEISLSKIPLKLQVENRTRHPAMSAAGTTTAVAPPPVGVTPNFDLSNGHLKTLSQVIAAVGLTLSTGCLLMRIYTKGRLLRNFWLDDVFIILAWMLSVAAQAVLLYGYEHSGYGIHIWNFTIPRLSGYQKTVLAASVLYIPALALAKLAILMLYYVLLHTVTKIWTYIIFGVGFIITGYSIAFVLAIIFGCSPLAKSWDPTIMMGSCINLSGIYLGTVITNTVSDVILILIPIPMVWKLRLPFLQRLGVIAIFGIGCLTIIMSIVRLATLRPFLISNDKTYKIAIPILFIFVEGNFIIICGCLPYLRNLLRHYAPRWIGESSSSGHSSNKSSRDKTKGRKPRLTQLQNDIERAMTVEGPLPGDNAQGEDEAGTPQGTRI